MINLLDIAKGSAGVDVDKTIRKAKENNQVNVVHEINLISRVYQLSFELITQSSNRMSKAISLVNDDEFLQKIKNLDRINDGEMIAIAEALRWTAHYIETGEKLKFYLTFIPPKGMNCDNADSKSCILWNSILLEDTIESYDYPIRDKNVVIRFKSDIAHEVIME